MRHEPLIAPTSLAVHANESARRRLGATLRRDDVAVSITEVEAHCRPDDTANLRAGRTARSAPMWGRAGAAYVYRCYGLQPVLNVVCGAPEEGTAAPIRAAQPLASEATITARPSGRSGPAVLAGTCRLARALGLDARGRYAAAGTPFVRPKRGLSSPHRTATC